MIWIVGTHYVLTESEDGSFFQQGKSANHDTLFADRLGESPLRTVARSFGLGSDWMTQLEWVLSREIELFPKKIQLNA